MCMFCRSFVVLLYLFFWPLCCLFFSDIRVLITPLVSSNSSFGHCVVCSSPIYGFWLPLWYLQTLLLAIVLSVLLRYTGSDYPFGIFKLFFWPLCFLFFSDIRILITPLVSSNSSFVHCVVCSSPIYWFWFPLWYLQTLLLAIVLSVLLRYTGSDFSLGIFKLFFWPLCCLFLSDIRVLISP